MAATKKRELLLGNDAVTRGLVEAGVRVASTYPGTPSSEVGNNLERIAKDNGMYFEFSSNEKIAMEVAAAAASSGLRSFVFMKHVGLNVAADPMLTLAYSGVTGGMLIMSADDPSAHSSQNEQDNRYYATLALLPMLEPSTPAEAKDMIVVGFDISEELTLPIIFRTTTRVNHARGIVNIGDVKVTKEKGHFVKDTKRFVNVPANARLNRIRLLELNKKAAEMSEKSKLNFIEGDSDIGVITSGVGYTYAKECLSGVSILKLGFTNPLPEKKILKFIKDKKKIIIIEELEPFLEDQVLRIKATNNLNVPVIGKRSGHLPREYEYSPDVMQRLSKIVKMDRPAVPLNPIDIKLPARPPTLCAGCPHRGIFAATRKAAGKQDIIHSSDIGCYTLGIQPPFNAADYIICMGGGVGSAGGFSAATDQKTVAFIGDSTFFHSGIAPLMSAKFNGHKFTAVILDNRTTAMTGHQPNPGTGRDHGGIKTEAQSIEDVVKSIGIGFIETVDPYDVKHSTEVMKKAIDYDGVSVVISKQACPLELKRRKALGSKVCVVNQDKCIGCFACVSTIACPALVKKDKTVKVDETQCIGCGMCNSVCPKSAIEVKQ
jgi:indolepyruvate ferredoxin oxidoreductase, alpha subunit